MQRIAAFLCLLLTSISWADPVPLEVKGGDVKIVKVDKVTVIKVDLMVVTSFPFTINAPPGGGLYFWTFPLSVVAIDKGEQLEVTSAPNGPLSISVKVIAPNLDKDGKFIGFLNTFGSTTFNVGTLDPIPPPIPPVPPVPPTPVNPSPFTEGFHVLILWDDKGAKLPEDQQSIFRDSDMRAYVESHCATDPDGRTKSYRFWPMKDGKVDGVVPKMWADAIAASADVPLPKIILGTSKDWYKGPLPKNKDEALPLFKKYGGN